MTIEEKVKAGYAYAEKENAALAGMAETPSIYEEPNKDPYWQRGYDKFHEELSLAP